MHENELTETENALDMTKDVSNPEDDLNTAEDTIETQPSDASEPDMIEVKFSGDEEPEDINVYEVISQRYRDDAKICSIKALKAEFSNSHDIASALKDLQYSGDILISFGRIYPAALIPGWKRALLSMYRWLVCSVLCLIAMLAVNAVLEARQFDGVVDTPGLMATKYFLYALAVICVLSFAKAMYNAMWARE